MNQHLKQPFIGVLVSIVALSTFFSCETKKIPNAESASKNEHDASLVSNKEQERYALPGLDHGLHQSPINILTNKATLGSDHEVKINYKENIREIENKGHTIQLNFEEGSSITVDGEDFDFKQLHFHTPSEHLIDGITYPMEMHIVHTLHDQKEGEDPRYLVVGILFKMGDENLFINEFINSVPKKAHSKKKLEAGEVKLQDLFEGHNEDEIIQKHDYYHYMGSLTTEPYTETVSWFVSKHIFEASPEQIMKINSIEGNNARHVQVLYDREIEE
ncbi:carbonic anhydrase family protein [Fulvivirgaceae bacterium BMA10]|uniref:Carbonic anhydrase n=1 Tax=Splendidivirga corallicola TaxID=3051826 RepID=A0ABT8KVH4_9BACT|nr:carbonic anhydrase family protein [Fulvivirgaceae bacterium BMA10]